MWARIWAGIAAAEIVVWVQWREADKLAIYDITARTVYLPSGRRLEAHSGLEAFMDNPRNVHVRMRGSTPPNVDQKWDNGISGSDRSGPNTSYPRRSNGSFCFPHFDLKSTRTLLSQLDPKASKPVVTTG